MELGRVASRCEMVSKKLGWLPFFLSRISVGWIFLESGWGKLHNIPKVVEFFQSLGIPFAHLQAPFVAGVELVFGACLLVGILSRTSSVLLSSTMVVAVATAKRSDITSVSDLFGMSEYLYIVILSWIFVYGTGPCSISKFCQRFKFGRH